MGMVAFFCGGFYIPGDIDEFLKNSKSALSWANHTLQWGFIKGLGEYYSHLECISVPQIGAYPFRYRRMRYSGSQGMDKNGVYTVAFLNLPLYKYWSQYLHFRKLLEARLETVPVGERAVVYVYDLNVGLLKAVVKLKAERTNIRLCLIVPDLSTYTGERSFLHQQFIRWQEKQLQHFLAEVDFFVLISEYMREKLPVPVDRYLTVEGIYNPSLGEEHSFIPDRQGLLPVFYSGAVSGRNGILNLLEAFSGIEDDRYRLYICGTGDAVTEVQQYAARDSRIIYKGQLLQQEVWALQRQSVLLVNPRTPELAFSRYSFPSKTMEYFASGVPVVMYKLDGIPDEYYRYCYCPDDFSVEALRAKIVEVCSKSGEELSEKGQAARCFVERVKNPAVQCKRIYDFIRDRW